MAAPAAADRHGFRERNPRHAPSSRFGTLLRRAEAGSKTLYVKISRRARAEISRLLRIRFEKERALLTRPQSDLCGSVDVSVDRGTALRLPESGKRYRAKGMRPRFRPGQDCGTSGSQGIPRITATDRIQRDGNFPPLSGIGSLTAHSPWAVSVLPPALPDFADTSVNAITQGSVPLLIQLWIVPRCTSTSPALR